MTDIGVKAIIFKPDRRNEVVRNPKVEGEIFKHKDVIYRIHPDRFQITSERNWRTLRLTRRHYATYYYTQGATNPWPVPDGKGIIVNSGISGEELASLFTPWFYRIIAAKGMTGPEKILIMAAICAAVGTIAIAYMLMTGNYSLPK